MLRFGGFQKAATLLPLIDGATLALPSPDLSQSFLTTASKPAWMDASLTTGNRMMFDATGKLTWAPNNLLRNSNTFNATWSGTNITVTGGQSDPDGGANAYKLAADAAQTNKSISQSAIAGTANDLIAFDLTTGAASNIVGTGSDATATNLGDGWWRASFKSTTGTGARILITVIAKNAGWNSIGIQYFSGAVYLYPRLSNASAGTGDGTSGIFVYKSAASLVTYETAPRPGDQVVTTSIAYYGPRFDYDPDTLAAKGLLIEESRTNVVLWNRSLNNAAWTKTNITAALNQTGIDGTANSASSITATSSNGTCLQAITLASSQRFQTAYVKRLTGTGGVDMTTDGGTTWTPITVAASWTRVSIPAQTVTNPSVGFRIQTNGDAIAVDFVQNETGSFATSPIPTFAASTTRAADIIKLTDGALTPLQAAAGAFLQEITLLGDKAADAYGVIGSTVSPFYLDNALAVKATNGTNVLSASQTAVVSTPGRAGIAWDAGGRSISWSGSNAVSDANAFGSIGSTVYLGSNNGSNVMNGWVRSLSFYNARLTDAQLKAKTAVGGPL